MTDRIPRRYRHDHHATISRQQLDRTIIHTRFLRFFHKKYGPYKKGVRELADDSCCGSKDAAARALNRLIERGLVIDTPAGYAVSQNETILSQNETTVSQNETVLSQNETELKERSKENINNIRNDKLTNTLSVGQFEFSKDFIVFWDVFNPQKHETNKFRTCRLEHAQAHGLEVLREVRRID